MFFTTRCRVSSLPFSIDLTKSAASALSPFPSTALIVLAVAVFTMNPSPSCLLRHLRTGSNSMYETFLFPSFAE